MTYQVRSQGGAIDFYKTFSEAFAHDGGDWDKISFSTDNGRLLLRRDGSWEYWTVDSLLKMEEEQ